MRLATDPERQPGFDPAAARRLLDELCERHGVDFPVRLRVSRRMTRNLGAASHKKDVGLITLSAYLGEDQWEDTLRHEFAHLLVGPGHGHDEVWKSACVVVGADPTRLAAAPLTHRPSRMTVIYSCPCGAGSLQRAKAMSRSRLARWRCRQCHRPASEWKKTRRMA